MEVLATGYFHSGNLGDDAMKEALVDYLHERVWDAEFVWCELPDASLGNWRNAARFCGEIRRSDKLLLVGGTHYHDDFGARSLRILFTFYILFALARVMNCSPSSVAVGLGPLQSKLGQRLVGGIIRLSELTTVRDERSLHIVRSLAPSAPVLLGVDLALLLAPRDIVKPSTCILGISIIPYFGYIRSDPARDEAYVARLAMDLASVVRSNKIEVVHVIVACTSQPGGDEEISRKLYDHLRELDCPCHLVPYTSPEEFLLEVGQLSFFICSRYHTLLLSQLQSVPVLLIPYQEKCVSLADQLGLSAEMRLTPEDALRGDLLEAKLHDLVKGEFATDGLPSLQKLKVHGLDALDTGFVMMGFKKSEVIG